MGIEVLLFVSLLLAVAIGYRVGSVHVFSPVALYTYLFVLLYGVRSFLLLAGWDVPFPEKLFPDYMENTRITALAIALVFALTFGAGLCLRPLARVGGVFLPTVPRVMPYVPVLLAVGVLWVASGLVLALPVSQVGWDMGAITRLVRLEHFFAGAFFVMNIAPLCGYISLTFVFAVLYGRRFSGGEKRITPFVLGVVLLMGMSAVGTTLFYGDRDQVFFFLIYALLGTSVFVRKIPLIFMVGFGVLLVWGMSVLQILRLQFWGYELAFSSLIRQVSAALNLDLYDKSLLMLTHFSTTGFRGGVDYWLGLVGVIPRSLWVNKPLLVDPGVWLRSQFFPEGMSGWPLTVAAEWFMNFGWVGVAVGGLVSGIIYAVITRKYAVFTENPWAFMMVFILCLRVFPLGYNTTTPMWIVLWLVPLWLFFMGVRVFVAVFGDRERLR